LIVKMKVLKPEIYEDGALRILTYSIESEKWEELEVSSRKDLLSEMLTVAQNKISQLGSIMQFSGRYVVVEVESLGLKAMRCEGAVPNTTTLLFPVPKPIRRIVLLKKEGEVLKPVREIKFSSEAWVFDTLVNLYTNDLDAILVETLEEKRLILKEELSLPLRSKQAEVSKKARKKRRRKSRKTRAHVEKSKKSRE